MNHRGGAHMVCILGCWQVEELFRYHCCAYTSHSSLGDQNLNDCLTPLIAYFSKRRLVAIIQSLNPDHLH